MNKSFFESWQILFDTIFWHALRIQFIWMSLLILKKYLTSFMKFRNFLNDFWRHRSRFIKTFFVKKSFVYFYSFYIKQNLNKRNIIERKILHWIVGEKLTLEIITFVVFYKKYILHNKFFIEIFNPLRGGIYFIPPKLNKILTGNF